jgi:hypothetical protein
MGGPGLQQGAVHREVLIAEQRLHVWSCHHLVEEALHELLIEQPLTVLGECCGMPDRIIGILIEKPAEEQVVLQLLQQKPLAADAVERLQERGQQQLLGRHRWPGFCGVQRTEGGVEPIKGLIGQLPDPPERVAGRNPLLDGHVGEQGAVALLLTSHVDWAATPFTRGPGFSANS